jgi:dihydrofolate synthase/folylpolyglutamate synthase
MDHEAYLGNSLTEIAGEKAGIIKPGVPVVSGAIHPEAAAVIGAVAQAKSAPVFSLGQEFDYAVAADKTWVWTGGNALANREIAGLRCSRSSLVQQENDSLAIAALQLLRENGFKGNDQHICEGLANVKWPGRMEYFEQKFTSATAHLEAGNRTKNLRYLLDGAHNTDGVRNLAKTLGQNFEYKKLIGIWGAMVDKDLAATLGLIAPVVDDLIITQPDGERAATPEHIYSILNNEQKRKARCVKKVDDAVLAAQETAEDGDLIVVGGSLYLIGAVRHLLLGELVK